MESEAVTRLGDTTEKRETELRDRFSKKFEQAYKDRKIFKDRCAPDSEALHVSVAPPSRFAENQQNHQLAYTVFDSTQNKIVQL
ncbi:MAG: hypothetical protein Q9162_004319 [Coniocarpon cinnabarinum]